MMQKMFGPSRADLDMARNRDKSFANLGKEREKSLQKLAMHESTLEALQDEVEPLLKKYKALVAIGAPADAQRLLPRLAALDKRIQLERRDIQDLKNFDRIAEQSLNKRDKQKTTNGMLLALKQVAPYIGEENAASADVIGDEEAAEILGRVTSGHLKSGGVSISESLAQNVDRLDTEMSLEASATQSTESSASATAAMLARLGGDDVVVAPTAEDIEAERVAAKLIAAAEEADRRRTTSKKNPKVDLAADALLAEAAAKAATATTSSSKQQQQQQQPKKSAVKTTQLKVSTTPTEMEHSTADLGELDKLTVPADEPTHDVRAAEALTANGKPATRRVRHRFDDDQ